MKMSLFPRLAWTGIRNNRKLYVPYLLTCIGMVMMHYIINYLAYTDVLLGIRGGWALQSMLSFGGWIIAFFSFLFLNYSNSFLMRRRKKEFGLYNILGMDKKNLSAVLLCETLITAALSLALGLFAGIALSKLAELCLINMMGGETSYRLTLSMRSITEALLVFSVIFAFVLLRALWQIRKSSAINLLRSESAGEKLPRFYGFWGVLGAIVLAAAYCIAVSIKDPLSALVIFFVAVTMVILATYLLFASGSVLLCKLLQKNKRYYYKANHFVSVSSMAYRMTRNGAGLASICILLTMVLVMLSSTSCLFFGVEDALSSRYPREFSVGAYAENLENATDEKLQPVRDYLSEIIERHGAAQENVLDYRAAEISGQLHGSELETDASKMVVNSTNIYGDVRLIDFIPLEDYNRITGESITLEEDEILIYAFRTPYEEDTLTILGCDTSFRVKEHLDSFPIDGNAAMNMMSTLYVVVPDFTRTLAPLSELRTSRGDPSLEVHWIYGFDVNASAEVQRAIYSEMDRDDPSASGLRYIRYESREHEREDFTGTFAGLFALGLMLSVVFLFAAVLIIYYKQITEGYEDQKRFEIMQKVGMTKRDIRRSINSQMLTVFLLPLLTAGLHLAFAFPMIRLLLMMFNMTNVALFLRTTLISFAVFGLFYVIVYRITSNAYFSIVSGARAD